MVKATPVLSRTARRRNLAGYLFILPALIGVAAFYLFPMGFSLVMGFTDWNMKTPATFTGLANLRTMMADPILWKSIRVTGKYALIAVPLCNVYALLMASLLNTKVKGMSAYRTIFYIPSIVPAVASSAIWMFIYNPYSGLLNTIVTGLGFSPQMWIYSTTQVIPCMAVMAAWGAGNMAIIYLAGLQGVPAHLYEAIDIDGGASIHKFLHVTLPLISPVIFYNIVMSIINSMQAFTQGYIMTAGGPNNESMFYVLLLYNRAFKQSQMGLSCMMSWVLFLIIGILTAINFYGSQKWVYYEGV